MKLKNVLLAGLASIVLFGGGGGGGGGDPAPVPPATTDTYQLWRAWVNYATASSTRNFSISGSMNGVGVAGTSTSGRSAPGESLT